LLFFLSPAVIPLLFHPIFFARSLFVSVYVRVFFVGVFYALLLSRFLGPHTDTHQHIEAAGVA